jgi:hypothetical protein
MPVAFIGWENRDNMSYALDDPLAHMALSQQGDPQKPAH